MTIRLADDGSISAAVDLLRGGNVVAFPTETVYGLGADATQDNAVAKIFTIKGRPAFNPLIVHVARPDWVAGLAMPDGRVDILTRAFWPGPLTLVLRRRPDSPVALSVSPGLDTIAVRQPDHPVAAQLLSLVKRPLAAPSANPSGQVSPTTAAHVNADLGDRLDLILDGGACSTGIESTVLDLTGDTARILRPGAIGAADLSGLIGPVTEGPEGGPAISSPGQLDKHYAPALPVRLNAADARPGEALIGFSDTPDATLTLSASSDLNEAAANLFAALREVDDSAHFTGIAVMTIPDEGIGRAINDRLSRAAQGR
jgi:L-threonylcarbamoyladenylate synthase